MADFGTNHDRSHPLDPYPPFLVLPTYPIERHPHPLVPPPASPPPPPLRRGSGCDPLRGSAAGGPRPAGCKAGPSRGLAGPDHRGCWRRWCFGFVLRAASDANGGGCSALTPYHCYCCVGDRDHVPHTACAGGGAAVAAGRRAAATGGSVRALQASPRPTTGT